MMRAVVSAFMILPAPAAMARGHTSLFNQAGWTKTIPCGQKDLDVERQIICQSPDLRHEDRQINALFQQLLPLYRGQDRAVFLAGEAYWAVERAGCDASGADWRGQMAACEKKQMDRRLVLLQTLRAAPSGLKNSVTDYDYIEPWYLKMFAREYEGKDVHVVGWIEAQGCKSESPAMPHPAHIVEDGIALDMRFSALNEADVVFICEKGPGGWWQGTVKLDHGRPYLYETDMLGHKLP